MLVRVEKLLVIFHLLKNVFSFHIHEHMTEDELRFYFGNMNEDEIKNSYDIGILRKKENNNVLARVLGKSHGEITDIVYELFALGEKLILNMEKNSLLGKIGH